MIHFFFVSPEFDVSRFNSSQSKLEFTSRSKSRVKQKGACHVVAPYTSYHPFLFFSSADVLDNDMSPLEFMRTQFPPSVVKMSEESWRSFLSWFGFTKQLQTAPIGMLSDGQKSRLVFAMLAQRKNGVLLLDEPTNHLDLDAVDGLARAIGEFGGGVVLVSHDFRLIDQVAKEIWICEDKTVRRWVVVTHHESSCVIVRGQDRAEVGRESSRRATVGR